VIWGLFRVGRMLGPPKFKNAVPASQVRPTTGKGVGAVILVTSIIVIGITLAAGTVANSNGLLIGCIVGFSALILGSLFVRGVAEAHGKKVKLSTPQEHYPVITTTDMRARAAVLERSKTVASQKPCAPASVPSPEPKAHVVKPVVVKTYREILADRELTERLTRIAALLIVTCPDCGAGEAELCTFKPDAPVSLLDSERNIILHDSRIGLSVKQHIAKVTDVVAQYDDHVPETVWRFAV
jgi:hypothetical protein